MVRKQFHSNLLLVSLSGIGFSLPISEFLTSVFIIILVINWLTGTGLSHMLSAIQGRKEVLLFIAAWFVYLVWMFNSDNITQGLHDIRLKLPLLLLPLAATAQGKLTEAGYRIVLYSFVAGVLISTMAGAASAAFSQGPLLDHRELSLFVSHIRLALMICLSIFIILNFEFFDRSQPGAGIIPSLLALVWLAGFLFAIGSFTGIIILLICSWVTVCRDAILRRRPLTIYLSLLAPLLLVIVMFVLLKNMFNDFSRVNETGLPGSDEITLSGNPYTHDTGRADMENGYYVWRYISEGELESAWNRVSTYDYSGLDDMGHEIRFTLVRYLTSLGVRKDSAGVASLTGDDIRLIEKGYANSRYLDGTGLKDRVYEIFWQWQYYRMGGSSQGHSLTQRIEYLGTGWRVFRRFPLTGTGTGDLPDQFNYQYDLDGSDLEPPFRRISHNQYLTSLATFGIIGSVLFWLALILPAFIKRGFRNYLFLIFFLIAFLSMLNEDTLETHTGVTFFVFFYSLLLFCKPEQVTIN